MHELAVTESILNIVLKHAREHKAEKILTISLKIGELSDLVGDCIQFYFDYLSKNTIAEGAIIEIERSPVMFQCRFCNDTFEVSLQGSEDIVCPDCGAQDVALQSGREFYIKHIEVV